MNAGHVSQFLNEYTVVNKSLRKNVGTPPQN